MKTSLAREALLEAACTLFYQRGIKATSIDAILEKAGVARQSLYFHFVSKDGLAAEFLRLRDQRWRVSMLRFIAQDDKKPAQKLLAIFDFLQSWFSSDNFNGCAFINTVVEFSDASHPFHILAVTHKALVLDEIIALCKSAALDSPQNVAQQLALLMEGAIVTEQITAGSLAAQQAKVIAEIIIQRATH